ncbi:(3S,6E)-nerolidol synthase 1-like [Cucurbita pepo subsp. pepo]|uniref:(3S,6E)-nerolidol synthase 1-like n=1 Tax=Cucurbita pepo subsp. pepo TaxID=3664 RepID=UPI000C9D68A0|nr:(3S,6E)-nerolidol synthase 1-like [Cucurbita pepo subsp. pepo]
MAETKIQQRPINPPQNPFPTTWSDLNDPLEALTLIDAAHRLGIAYRFQAEIDLILQRHYAASLNLDVSYANHDLHEVALRFRLLRQGGYFVPSDMFEAFMDEDGHFKQELENDINGVMSLFEASQFCLPGEAILEEARVFSARIMSEYVMKNVDCNKARHVARALANPYHTSFSKFMVKDYFGMGDLPDTNRLTRDFQLVAKMDFNVAQDMRRRELYRFTQWWTDTGLGKVLGFARDQPLKWYICSLVCLTDPCFSEERVELSKPISFIYLIDDMFDVYASLDQLKLFTEAVRRWDVTVAEALPDCMRICFKSLYVMTNEISSKIHEKHGWNPINSLQKSWAKLCDAFLVESEWFVSGYSPSAKEYLRNGAVSSGVHVVLVHAFFLLGQTINHETVKLLDNDPEIISSTATILRLQDDLGSAKDENQDGYDGSYVNYYMKDNKDASIESSRQHIANLISYAWKKLNRECLSSSSFPLAFMETSLNIARFVPILYGYDDNQNLPTLKKLVKSMLYERAEI